MAQFVKFETSNGKTVFINPEHVVAIDSRRDVDEARITLAVASGDGALAYIVQETPDDARTMLERGA